MKILLSACLLSGICVAEAFAAQSGCKDQIEVTGVCTTVVGILNLTADNGPVLWTNRGTKSFAVRGDKDMPSDLYDVFNRDFAATALGSFQICPLPGKSRFAEDVVCIESVSSLAVQETGRSGRNIRLRKTR